MEGSTAGRTATSGETIISETFTPAERERFHNLLTLAAESPFEGERANALAAARRLAAKYGLTLDEAATQPKAAARAATQDTTPWTAAEVGRFVHLMDWQIHVAKRQREAALRAAQARGLDAEAAADRGKREPRVSRTRRNPREHARVLLTETSLRLHEIVEITGLDIYQVVGFKLKLRTGA